MDTSFLHQPVQTWGDNESYKEALNVVNNLRVVNDTAECGVKLGNDFIDTAKMEARYQNILQVVENDRKRIPNQRNPNIKSKSWFLSL